MKKLSPPTSIPEKPIFYCFDTQDLGSSEDYERNLPHLRKGNATYFVTFRLGDSIPKFVLEGWIKERNNWLESFGIDPKLAHRDVETFNELYYAIPAIPRREFELKQHRRVIIESDKCYGSCILKNTHEYVSNAIEHFHGERVWVGDYVVMPNHVHVLVQPFPGVALTGWLYSVKRFSSNQINKVTGGKQRHLWQIESHDRIVRNHLELAKMRRYIANNPVKLFPGTYSLKQMDWLDEFDLTKVKEEDDDDVN